MAFSVIITTNVIIIIFFLQVNLPDEINYEILTSFTFQCCSVWYFMSDGDDDEDDNDANILVL